jgi:hypothetical protein
MESELALIKRKELLIIITWFHRKHHARFQKPDTRKFLTVQSHLYNIFRKGKFIAMESQSEFRLRWVGGMTAKGH